jgi:hypothetical protein
MKTQWKHENLTYLALWGLLFIAPVLSLYIRSTTDAQLLFSWNEVFNVWRELLIFLLAFLLHNFLMAPLLIYRGRRWTYIALVAVIAGCFTVWQCSMRPDMKRMQPEAKEMRHDDKGMHPEGEGMHHDMEPHHMPPHGEQAPPPPRPLPERKPGATEHMNDKMPPVILGEHDIIAGIILLLMFGMNLGIKLYFKQRNDQQEMANLEKQNLEHQLEYLRYQINPHFFMNTLNNIHALVDIDPEKAKHTILELSKMMRFVLYEGNKKTVPLRSEFDFLRNYITLMSLRYTDSVKITVNLPEPPARCEVPPLLFVTFVENAFKHGISYQQPSFVDVRVALSNDTLVFHCQNSRHPAPASQQDQQQGGVGLHNIRERLKLIYGDRYSLRINEGSDTYNVDLILPL